MSRDDFYDKVIKLARSGWTFFKFYVDAFGVEYLLIKKPIDGGGDVWVCGESGLIGTADVHGITYDNMWVGYDAGIVYTILDAIEEYSKVNEWGFEDALETVEIDGR